MAINIDPVQLNNLVVQSEAEAELVAKTDLTYHDQHGDSLKWTAFEWDCYHKTIANALSRFRQDLDA